MARQITYEPHLKTCFVHWSGEITLQEGHDYCRDIVGYDWFRPGVRVLHDFRDAQLRLSMADVTKLVGFFNLIKEGFGDGQVAGIMGDSAGMNLAGIFVALGSETWRPLRAFLKYDDARDWLGLPDTLEDQFDDLRNE